MSLPGWFDVESIVLQATVDLVHLLWGLLDEANVEGLRVLDFNSLAGIKHGEHQPIIVGQKSHLRISFTHAL